MKAWTLAFLCAAYLPTAKFFVDVTMQGVLKKRLYHLAVDIVIAPLKAAVLNGYLMSDPCGNIRQCFTPLAACIVDNPEQLLIAGIGSKSSPITTATIGQFGNATPCLPRTGAAMLAAIADVNSCVDPWNLP